MLHVCFDLCSVFSCALAFWGFLLFVCIFCNAPFFHSVFSTWLWAYWRACKCLFMQNLQLLGRTYWNCAIAINFIKTRYKTLLVSRLLPCYHSPRVVIRSLLLYLCMGRGLWEFYSDGLLRHKRAMRGPDQSAEISAGEEKKGVF